MGLRILSWNCRSARNKVVELSAFLQNHFYHFVLLQETWLNSKVSFKIPGYLCLRQDRELTSQSSHGGVAILIHNSMVSSCSRVNVVEMDFVESIFVQVSLPSFSFLLASIYSPATCTAREVRGDIQKLFSRHGPFVFAGDFNAKHSSWNNTKFNYKGVHLRKICDENFCEIHHSEETTCFPATGELSLIDFVVSKGVIGLSKPIAINDLSSDHVPIGFEIPVSSSEFPDEIKVKNFPRSRDIRH
jgi:exonuclease III